MTSGRLRVCGGMRDSNKITILLDMCNECYNNGAK